MVCEGGRVVNVAVVIATGVNNEGRREVLGFDVITTEDGAGWTAFLRNLVARGLNNGPEFIAYAVADWYRFCGTWALLSTQVCPWQSAWSESRSSRLRDEMLNQCRFGTLLEAKVLLEDWRTEYNLYRPHQARGMLSLSEFARAWTTKQIYSSQKGWTT